MASEVVDASPLCCCEYINVKGERTHLLALLCDCEDLDNAVDKCFKGNKPSTEQFNKISNNITDRIRIPWPSGAKKLNVEIILPVILLSSSLYFASWHFVFTVLTLVYLPIFVFIFYVYSLRARKRSWFFVSWAVTSVIGIYVMFMLNISSSLSWNYSIVITVGFTLIIFFYYQVINSQGRLQDFIKLPHSSREQQNRYHENGIIENGLNGMQVKLDSLTCCFCTYGPFSRGKHCRICGYCVPRSDHHCVWTNCCIGHHNQGYFLLAILSFIITGSCGIYLTLQSICKPLPQSWYMDCSQVYSDPGSSLMFVCAFYSVVFIMAMALLFIQQIFFISFNITGDEWRRGSKHKSFLQVLLTNTYNKGLLQTGASFYIFHRII